MFAVSTKFLAAVTGSHGLSIRAVLCNPPYQEGVNPTGRTLALIGGQVNLDGTAQIRGSADVVLAERFGNYAAANPGIELLPYGATIFLSRGVIYGNGNIERVPLGYYRINTVEQDAAPKGSVHITGQDRMAGIIDAKIITPLQYPAATTRGAVVTALVQDVYPTATVDWDNGSGTAIGSAIITSDDRFDVIDQIVKAAGKIWYWDYRGHLVIKDLPSSTTPVWTVAAGAGGVLTGISRSVARENVFNAVVATGEAADDTLPVIGYAYDLNPASPTYWNGPYGHVPAPLYNSPLLVTQADADRAAAAQLAAQIGMPLVVDFSTVPNPALEPFDAVRVNYPLDLMANPHRRTEVHVLTQLGIPLAPDGAMMANTRAVSLT